MFMASSYELMTIYLALEISSLSLAFLAAWNKRELPAGLRAPRRASSSSC